MEDSMDTGKKPKLGVVFFAARWFDEVVLGNEEAARRFRGQPAGFLPFPEPSTPLRG